MPAEKLGKSSVLFFFDRLSPAMSSTMQHEKQQYPELFLLRRVLILISCTVDVHINNTVVLSCYQLTFCVAWKSYLTIFTAEMFLMPLYTCEKTTNGS